MRYLVVGLGNIGMKRQAILGSRCVATVDPYNPKADYKHPQECAENSYDAVILATPNGIKLELMHWFLERGKHVLVEKPLLFPHEETALQLQQLASSKKAIWYTSYNHRFEPLIIKMKEALEENRIGKIYQGRLFYGNGTVANAKDSWREAGLGVLEDLGSHLLDLLGYLFNSRGTDLEFWSLEKREAKTFDHCIFSTQDHRFLLEVTFLSWKNNFTIDLYGEKGSMHLKGLCKWGPSELIHYERIYPSGVPKEHRQSIVGPDITWKSDLEYFEQLINLQQSSFENDRWISNALQEVKFS